MRESVVDLICEEDEFIAVCKPEGMLVHHTEKGGGEKTLTDWLVERYPEMRSVGDAPGMRPGIVHRLDRGTSGVIIAARTQQYFEYLKSLFQEKKIHKHYLALVWGTMKRQKGEIDAAIGIRNGSVKRTVHFSKKVRMVKEAVTEYQLVCEGKDAAFVVVSPKTGRTHQIRVHMNSIGHPIVGDELYGTAQSKKFSRDLFSAVDISPRVMLHAWRLEFREKSGRERMIEAGPDAAFSRVLERVVGEEGSSALRDMGSCPHGML